MMEIQKFINELKDKSAANIRSQIYKRGILASYDPNDGRMIFYTSKNQRFSDADPLKLECNGLVFDSQNIEPLVIPSISYRSNIDTNIVNTYLSNDLYDILRVEDGTVINLYWWLDSWRISTARSYDLTDKKWGSLTYKEVLKSILGDNKEKFYNSLDISHSYTFGIKHEDSHPFWEGKNESINKIWFIQSTNLKDRTVSFTFENELEIQQQTKSDIRPKNVKELFSELDNSLDNFIYDGLVNYGYILRSKNPSKTGAHSNILLESSLLQKIRQLYYHSNLNMVAQEMKYDRNIYILVYSYLDTNRHILFRKLFPQYIKSFLELDEITSNLVRNIISYNNSKKNIKHNNPVNKIQMYTKIIHESLNIRFHIKPNDRNIFKLITTFLLTHRWIDVYYNLFTLSQ